MINLPSRIEAFYYRRKILVSYVIPDKVDRKTMYVYKDNGNYDVWQFLNEKWSFKGTVKTVSVKSDRITIADFYYDGARTDSNPRVVVLGKWFNPETNKMMVCGINLNYLHELDLFMLNQCREAIFQEEELQDRVAVIRIECGSILSTAYRTYDEMKISSLHQRFLKISKEIS